jgi:hypothetical protein
MKKHFRESVESIRIKLDSVKELTPELELEFKLLCKELESTIECLDDLVLKLERNQEQYRAERDELILMRNLLKGRIK